MKCPFCKSSDDKVIDSRPLNDSTIIRRRRQCFSCGKRFTTYERLESMPLIVIKSDNRREQFDRNKLREGIIRACEKRPISAERIEKIVGEIEYDLQNYVMEVKSSVLGEKVLNHLKSLDDIAYIRFASVYRQFDDVEAFRRELRKLKKPASKEKTGNK
ncbi:MAG: transcriptional regulator NrdR [bacterium]